MVTLAVETYRIALMIQGTKHNLTVSLMRSIVKFTRLSIVIMQFFGINNAKQDFGEIMKTLSDPEGDGITRGWMVFYGVISTIVYCIPRMIEECCRFWDVFPYIPWCTNELSNIMITRQFCIILTIIQKRISKLTKMMLSPSCSSWLAESYCEKHEQCLAIAIKTNEFYSRQLLVICIYIFLKFLNLMVEIILDKPEIDEQPWHFVLEAVANGFHALTLVILLLLLAGSCESTKKRVKEFHSALFKTMTDRPALRDSEWLNLYVEMSPTVEFTARDFFTIRYSLVTSVVAAVLTYLVIIVQFNDSS
ncbi:hypothetical protein GE061_003296 [Apolygus lucorum]|uniref:Gustatory receptor n=1 Tax=Apolygus lucorum TaxID=248454 RepID=A0A8S9X350_APOLU|nr:hypothetical protein GE061_003296 [Apolygus lucorum]